MDLVNIDEKTKVDSYDISAILQCVICNKDKPSYKCPRCRLKYCSAGCCSAHKLNCLIPKDFLSRQPSRTSAEMVTVTAAERSTILADKIKSGPFILDEHDETCLRNSQHLKSILKSERLQKHIMDIDSSNDRSNSLKKARINPEFEDFIQTLLTEQNLISKAPTALS
eukprot:gene9582-19917_t